LIFISFFAFLVPFTTFLVFFQFMC